MIYRRLFVVIILPLLMFSAGCSKYNQLLKSSDFDKKYEYAVTYYDKKDYSRAMPLFEELLSVFKGTARAENIYFYYAYCHYATADYPMASYHFKNFGKTFPNSLKREECLYMAAYCMYLDSPDPSLDQTSTNYAIIDMQFFINSYPKSSRLSEANNIIDKLRLKLETKSYNIAKLYYNIADYKAAIYALNNTLREYPDSKYREEVAYLVVKSSYLLAINSVEAKKEQRFKDTSKEYLSFVDKFPNNPFQKDAEQIYSDTLKELKKLKSNKQKQQI